MVSEDVNHFQIISFLILWKYFLHTYILIFGSTLIVRKWKKSRICCLLCILCFEIQNSTTENIFLSPNNPISTVDIFILWLCQCLQMVRMRMRGLPPLFFMVMVLMTQTSRGCVLEAGVEGCDKLVMSKFRRNTILRPFFDIFERLLETQNFFFGKITPRHCKNRFWGTLWIFKNGLCSDGG